MSAPSQLTCSKQTFARTASDGRLVPEADFREVERTRVITTAQAVKWDLRFEIIGWRAALPPNS
jgi:hypothetical protein